MSRVPLLSALLFFSSCRQGWCCRLFVVFSFLAFPHNVLYQHSPTPSMCCCCSPFSSHSFQIPLNAVLPSHSRSSLPSFSFHFLDIRFLCQFFMSNSAHITGTFQHTPHRCFLETFLHSTLHSQFVHSSLFTPIVLLVLLFSQTCAISCCFPVSVTVLIIINSYNIY